jgi:aryl-alcohol dehydrogenase-like predicted oxidoreductase
LSSPRKWDKTAILSRGPRVLAIAGTGNPDHLEENIAAGAIDLTTEQRAQLG